MINELKIISIKDENWAQIANFSRYWISDLGRVYDTKLCKLCRIEVEYDGYLLVSLLSDTKEHKSKRIHRLVAEAFLSDWNPEWPWTVNHINGVKSDNRLCNLEMLTAGDNSRHYQTAECFKESREASKAAVSKALKAKCADPEYKSAMSSRMKKVWADPDNRNMYISCLYERQADPSNRRKVSEKLKSICANPEYRKGMSDRQKANWNNPEYRHAIVSHNQDRIWVNKEGVEKWIHKSDLDLYVSKGYQLGRDIKNMKLTTQGKVRMYKGTQTKFIRPEDVASYTSQGWKHGRANRRHVQCVETGQIFDSVEECAKTFGTNVDLINSRCKGIAKNFRKLKEYHFIYYEYEEN